MSPEDSREVSPETSMTPREWILVLLAMGALTLLWTAPFLPHLGSRIPDPAPGHDINAADARIVVWAMAWEARALATDPSSFFDANVFHPARGMLTGSDTFLTPALLAAPVYFATGNAILGANLLTMVTYGACFLLMYVLVRRSGLGPAPSAIAGIAVALGPFRLPADVHTLQYSSTFLVLVLLACARLPNRAAVVAAAVAIAMGLFASFYTAAMVLILLGIEVLLALGAGDRTRAGRVIAATVPGGILLLLLAVPWLSRSGESGTLPTDLLASFEAVGQLFQPYYLNPSNRIVGMGWAVAALSLVGLVTPFFRREPPSKSWWRFTLIALAGVLLAVGPSIVIGGVRIPMPYSVLIETPARALRAFPRFIILAHVGFAGLAAIGAGQCLSVVRSRFTDRRVAAVAASVLVVATLVPRSIGLASTTFTRIPVGDVAREFYTTLAAGEPGPLLEIPAPWSAGALKRKILQAEFMIESTRHWRPILNGHTGYPPWWWEWLRREIYLIPEEPAALQSVVDATGLRWILVHRVHAGQIEWERWLGARSRSDLELVKESSDHLLFRVTTEPQRPWLDRLRASDVPDGETLLGTPLTPLVADDVRGRLALVEAAERVGASQPLSLHVTVENDGPAGWPALAPRLGDDAGLVVVESVWIDSHGSAEPVRTRTRLVRDVLPGEAQHNWLELEVPAREGDYVVELSLRQVGVGTLEGIAPLSVPITVTNEPPAG